MKDTVNETNIDVRITPIISPLLSTFTSSSSASQSAVSQTTGPINQLTNRSLLSLANGGILQIRGWVFRPLLFFLFCKFRLCSSTCLCHKRASLTKPRMIIGIANSLSARLFSMSTICRSSLLYLVNSLTLTIL